MFVHCKNFQPQIRDETVTLGSFLLIYWCSYICIDDDAVKLLGLPILQMVQTSPFYRGKMEWAFCLLHAPKIPSRQHWGKVLNVNFNVKS